MIISTPLHNNAHDTLNRLFEQAIEAPALMGTKQKFRLPALIFNQRGKTAGSAQLQKNIININPRLYTSYPDYFISNVIAHELSHILVYQLYGLRVKPHGVEWKKIMLEVFHLAPKVTHSLDVSDLNMRSVRYKCECQEVALSIIRHNKVVNKKQQYICRKCKTQLYEISQ